MGPNTNPPQTVEIFLNNEKILEYTYSFPSPEKFEQVYTAIKVLWPDAVIQFPKEKKDVRKVPT
jgi:hypothetical protein